MELYSNKIRNFSGGSLQSLKNKQKNPALKKFFVSYDVFAIFTAVKHKEIPCETKIEHKDITYKWLNILLKHL